MNQLTLHQLQIFAAVARNKSFSLAAKELFMSQGNVSLQISKLTKSIGFALLEKIGNRIYLTEVGMKLYMSCGEMFDVLDKLETNMTSCKELKQGKLRIATIATASNTILRSLGNFRRLYPEIQVSLQIGNHKEIVERINNNLDDLYIMSNIPSDLEVQSKCFSEDSLIVVAANTHPLANLANIPIAQLGQEQLLMREPGSETHRFVKAFLEQYGIKPKTKLEFGSHEAIRQGILAGLGISILSRHVLESNWQQLISLNVEHFPIKRHFYLVYANGKQLSISARNYGNFLLEPTITREKMIELNNKLKPITKSKQLFILR
jgi:DNA-binding transcriptional LysR family regulator